MPLISLQKIGSVARDQLAQAELAQVVGQSSRGCFLRLSNGWVIFISAEAFCGPLTLNLLQSGSPITLLRESFTGRVTNSGIYFPDADVKIELDQAKTWRTHAPPIEMISPNLIKPRLVLLLDQIRMVRSPGILANQGFACLGLGSRPGQVQSPGEPFVQLLHAIQGGRIEVIVDILAGLLGVGEGLTPAGDDLVLGFLLACSRWETQVYPALNTTLIGDELTRLAYQKTTRLSANLIECATQGQADERLVLALDGLVTGQPGEVECTRYLLSWGNSSGIEALCGMALALNQ